jgi:membrane-associated protease RseP (regulator of RpoE activity)
MKNLFLFIFALCTLSLHAHDDKDAVMGIKTTHISKDKAEKLAYEYPYGSRIDEVHPESPAAEAGFQPLDYIYQIDDQKVSKDQSTSDILDAYKAGDRIKVYYQRNGEMQTASLTLRQRADIKWKHTPDAADPFLGIDYNNAGNQQKIEGVAVNIVHNSTAEAMGLEDGDIITAIDDYPLIDWHDTNVLIDNREVGDPIKVTYYRDGAYQSVERPIKSKAATRNSHSRPDGPKIIQAKAEDESYSAEVDIVEIDQEEELLLEEAAAIDIPEIADLQIKALNVFPNPTTGIFDIQFTLNGQARTSIYIYNPNGQPVYFNELGDFTGTFNDRIDIANGVRGIYFLQIRQGEETLTRKIVLQ